MHRILLDMESGYAPKQSSEQETRTWEPLNLQSLTEVCAVVKRGRPSKGIMSRLEVVGDQILMPSMTSLEAEKKQIATAVAGLNCDTLERARRPFVHVHSSKSTRSRLDTILSDIMTLATVEIEAKFVGNTQPPDQVMSTLNSLNCVWDMFGRCRASNDIMSRLERVVDTLLETRIVACKERWSAGDQIDDALAALTVEEKKFTEWHASAQMLTRLTHLRDNLVLPEVVHIEKTFEDVLAGKETSWTWDYLCRKWRRLQNIKPSAD